VPAVPEQEAAGRKSVAVLPDGEGWLDAKRELAQAFVLPPSARLAALIIPRADGPTRMALVQVEPDEPFLFPMTFAACPPEHIELLGQAVETIPASRGRPYLSLGAGAAIEVCVARCRLGNRLAACTVAWPATGATSTIQLGFGRWRMEDLAAIAGVVKWLETIPRLGGAPAASDRDAFEEAVRLGAEWLRENPGKSPADLKSRHLAARKAVEPRSYEKWMAAKHFGIKAVRARLLHIRGG
jgi:hypothetical protein